MAMLSLKVATEIWSPEHSSARMHRLLGPAVFVRRSLDPAVLISLSMVCGRNALACVRQSAQTPLVGWLVALPQVELDTTLADVTRIPLNNAHNVSLANCKRQMTSSLVQCAGCRCLDRRPVSRTSLPKRRPTLRSRFHVCFLRLHGHLRACLSSERLPLHASTLPKCTSR